MIEFGPILQFIRQNRQKALAATNYYMLQVYWQIGGYIHHKLAAGSWGEKVVDKLASWLKDQEPGIKGFERTRLYRMRSFYATGYCIDPVELSEKIAFPLLYDNQSDIIVSIASIQFEKNSFKIVATLSPQIITLPPFLSLISWSHHIELLVKTKLPEEQLFYLILASKERYTVRELRRQIDSCLFERHMLSNKNIKPINHPEAAKIQQFFRDTYITEFLDLPEPHSEKELQKPY